MTRRTVTATLTGGLLLGALALPAAANPVDTRSEDDGRTTVCVGTNREPGATQREGICVWVPIDLGRR